jgi:nucleotide-binding universal stress UspA family protein
MRFNKILIPHELDQNSLMATEYAISLAKKLGISEIVLLNLIIPAQTQAMAALGAIGNSPIALTGEFNTTLEKKHREMLEEEANRVRTEDITISPHVRFSGSKSHLNEYMKEFDANLIVCASRDSDTFLKTIFGSETHRMIHNADYPMIILKEKPPILNFSTIALAIDVDDEEYHGLDPVVALAAQAKTTLELVHVIEDDEQMSSEETIKKLHALAIEKNLKNYSINIINNPNLDEGIRNYIRKNRPDMVAVLTQGKGKLEKLIFGSGTDTVLEEIDKPVLVGKMIKTS